MKIVETCQLTLETNGIGKGFRERESTYVCKRMRRLSGKGSVILSKRIHNEVMGLGKRAQCNDERYTLV